MQIETIHVCSHCNILCRSLLVSIQWTLLIPRDEILDWTGLRDFLLKVKCQKRAHLGFWAAWTWSLLLFFGRTQRHLTALWKLWTSLDAALFPWREGMKSHIHLYHARALHSLWFQKKKRKEFFSGVQETEHTKICPRGKTVVFCQPRMLELTQCLWSTMSLYCSISPYQLLRQPTGQQMTGPGPDCRALSLLLMSEMNTASRHCHAAFFFFSLSRPSTRQNTDFLPWSVRQFITFGTAIQEFN